MSILLIAFLVSSMVVTMIVRWTHFHGVFSMDHDLEGIQKIHSVAVPRIGGLGIFAGFALAFAFEEYNGRLSAHEHWELLICSAPVFLSGFAEDLTKQISASLRLVCAAGAAALACWALQAIVTHTNVPGLDLVLLVPIAATAFTILGVAGVVHSINLIDGLNGLASVVTMIILASLAYVAHAVGDSLIVSMALALIGAILGFVQWNYPVAKVFLGDGGAYFTGFFTAELLILLITRHKEVSPFYALLVTIYPVFETLFSMYRRMFLRGVPVGAPDRGHLHALLFRRAVKADSADNVWNNRNSRTTPRLWILTFAAVVPATLFWNEPLALVFFSVLFCMTYVWLYFSIARFKTPSWLKSR
ncbi:UDP-N-acetylmuramyl pentapeptide phosphotransferase/UDP-N-acetylglucosamine-1-phosphate transferase [Paraburkholderia unamae]|uniref:glycosyltransferase n=1 Tax=Paraburkholderia unamae TaxID=219649 RepID=UPI000DC43E1E|nr:glycosyltransferase [Paraburkholderia unamae]RAR58899.1 UDP-N-acetylmuramyl pentapeptide phosphotransferase/UDP-N-acetylglucosamine-1-phosphate transferase [Paraburkholderia unamae]